MRKNFVYFVLIPFILVSIVVYLFIDGWVESGLEAAGESIVGARVEIDNLKVTLSPIALQWGRMQVADPHDPWRNLFETRGVRFAMDAGQLLRGKFIIETMEVNELILGTKRTTDGSLPKAPPRAAETTGGTSPFTATAQQALNRSVEATPAFGMDALRKGFKPDSLVAAMDFGTLKEIDSLKRQVGSASSQWDASLKDLETSRKSLEDGLAGVRAIDVGALKGVDQITSALATVDNARKRISDAQQTLTSRQSAIEESLRKLSGSTAALDAATREDVHKLLAAAHLPSLDAASIAGLLVGREMVQRATTYLSWVDVVREKIKKQSPAPEMEAPARFRGQNIHFPSPRAYPKLWIKKIAVSGGTDSTQDVEYIHAAGVVANVSNDQTITGAPLSARFEGTEGKKRSLTLSALIDRTKDIPLDEFAATLTGVPMQEFRIGRSDFLPASVSNAVVNSSVQLSVPGDQFDLRTRFDFSSLKLNFESPPRNTVETILRDVLNGIPGFTVEMRLWNPGTGFNCALATNLDDLIAGKIQAAIGAGFQQLQSELQGKLNDRIASKRKEFESLYSAKRAEIEKSLGTYQNVVSQQTSLLDGKQKELTDRLQKEQKGKVEDALKGLFKK